MPTTVGGNPQGLSRYLKILGFRSETWALKQNYFGFKADNFIMNSKFFLINELKKIYSLNYIFKCDLIFFNYGSSLFSPLPYVSISHNSFLKYLYIKYCILMQKIEFFLIQILNKKVLIQYQGDDARQGQYSLENFEISIADKVQEGYYSNFSDTIKKKQIKLMDKNCSFIYALNPDLLHVLPKRAKFIPYSHISMDEWNVSENKENTIIKIGHAPSNRSVKGTEFIIKILDELKINGFNFELVLIEGLSNYEAKKIYSEIDILIDQIYAGWYGGLAVELMALESPVVAYIRDEDLKFLPSEMRNDIPIINANESNLKFQLKKLLSMSRNEIKKIGKKSREYVLKWHNPDKISKEIEEDILKLFS